MSGHRLPIRSIELLEGPLQANTITVERPASEDQDHVEWIRQQLVRFSYKPNWTFTLDVNRFQEPAIIISFLAEDAYKPGQFIQPESIYPISWCKVTNAEVFRDWLLAATLLVEMHECLEVFKRDGKQVFGPHRPENRDWSLEMYDQVNNSAMRGQNPLFEVLYMAAKPAVAAGTVRSEPIVTAENRSCINALARNIPLRAFAA